MYFSRYANRRGAKSAKSLLNTLLSLLALPHIGIFCRTLDVRECEADLGRGSAALMSRVCAKCPFVVRGAASKEAHLYAHFQESVSAFCSQGSSTCPANDLGSTRTQVEWVTG